MRALVLNFGGVLTTFFDGALHSYCLRDGLAPDALENIFNLDQSAQGALVNVERGRIIEAQFVAHIAAALSADPDRLLKWPPFTPPTQPPRCPS